MTHYTISQGMARRTFPLLRRVDGVELPVAGTWNVPGDHATVAFSVPRRLRRAEGRVGTAREATLVFSHDPADVLVAVLFDAPDLDIAGRSLLGPPIHLEARSVPGPHRWVLSGEVFPDSGVLPVRATLAYHGVWRRGGRAYGWFALAGTIGPDAERTQRGLGFSFDLLAYGPDALSRPASAPSRSLYMRAISQTGGAA